MEELTDLKMQGIVAFQVRVYYFALIVKGIFFNNYKKAIEYLAFANPKFFY